MRKCFILWLLGIAAVVTAPILFYHLARMGWPNNPEGIYASYDFLPHDPTDVLRFKNGLVTWEGRCGNENWKESYGTYKEEKPGYWVWTLTHQKRPADKSKWHYTPSVQVILQPHLFDMEFIRVDNNARQTMSRRVFTFIPY